LQHIFERYRESRRPGFWQAEAERRKVDKDRFKPYPSAAWFEYCLDPVLHELLLAERKRQQEEILEAIDRVCDVIQRSRQRRTPSHA